MFPKDTHSKPNEHVATHSATPNENKGNVYFELYSILNYKTKQKRRIMGSCLLDNHFAEDHIHKDIKLCNIEEPNISTALERSLIDIWEPYTYFNTW